MWPFKKKPVMTEEEYAATRPPAPCGDQKTHVHWTELEGRPCPICTRIEKEQQALKAEDRLAEKIANAVMRKLHEKGA